MELNTHPEAHDQCVTILTDRLEHYTENHPELNGFLIWMLQDLEVAADALPTIRKAFEEEYVDYSEVGDIEDVEIKLGIRSERSTPADHPTLLDKYPGFKEEYDKSTGQKKKKRKIGRNDPCPCGSGKKYKKCCLGNPDGPILKEYLAMFSKQKIEIPQKKKEELKELLWNGKYREAVQHTQQFTDADLRLIEDYLKRLFLSV